jgi:hypothetical protein
LFQKGGKECGGRGKFGHLEPELFNVLGVYPMVGVGGREGESRLEGSGESTGSSVGGKDGEKKGPVFAVVDEGLSGGVEGVKCEAMGRSSCEVGDDVDSHSVLSEGRNRPKKLGFYFD